MRPRLLVDCALMKARTKPVRRTACALALSLAAALTSIAALPGAASPHGARTDVSAAIDTVARGKPVPSGYLGLSFELSSLGEVTRLGEHGNLIELLRSLGPGVLRFGGVSADTQVAWAQSRGGSPHTATISAHDLAGLAPLARA